MHRIIGLTPSQLIATDSFIRILFDNGAAATWRAVDASWRFGDGNWWKISGREISLITINAGHKRSEVTIGGTCGVFSWSFYQRESSNPLSTEFTFEPAPGPETEAAS